VGEFQATESSYDRSIPQDEEVVKGINAFCQAILLAYIHQDGVAVTYQLQG